jgi:hypothetical protein
VDAIAIVSPALSLHRHRHLRVTALPLSLEVRALARLEG